MVAGMLSNFAGRVGVGVGGVLVCFLPKSLLFLIRSLRMK